MDLASANVDNLLDGSVTNPTFKDESNALQSSLAKLTTSSFLHTLQKKTVSSSLWDNDAGDFGILMLMVVRLLFLGVFVLNNSIGLVTVVSASSNDLEGLRSRLLRRVGTIGFDGDIEVDDDDNDDVILTGSPTSLYSFVLELLPLFSFLSFLAFFFVLLPLLPGDLLPPALPVLFLDGLFTLTGGFPVTTVESSS